jgi:hypothetical protein
LRIPDFDFAIIASGDARNYFGIAARAPGGGMTGMTPPPTRDAAIPESTPAGGQITPFERDSWSLRFVLPVGSPGAGKMLLPR